MARCQSVKGDNSPCERIVPEGTPWCYSHDPARAEERKAHATKGGKSRGPGPELREVQGQLRKLADDVLAERVSRGNASVAAQVLGVYVRSCEVARKLRETEELERRIEELEAERDQDRYGTGGGVGW